MERDEKPAVEALEGRLNSLTIGDGKRRLKNDVTCLLMTINSTLLKQSSSR